MTRDNIVGTLQGDSRLSGGLSVGGGTTDYNELENKPTYNGHVIEGELTSESLGIWQPKNFSTEEQETGIKWINEKPIYQKTCNVTSDTNCNNTSWTFLPLDNPIENPDYMIDAVLHGQCPNTNRVYRFQFEDGVVKIASLTSEYILANTKITFKYTKTTD